MAGFFVAANHLEPKRETVRRLARLHHGRRSFASIPRRRQDRSHSGSRPWKPASPAFFDIFVLQELREPAAEKKLMESLMAQARSAGAEQGYCRSWTTNTPALALYGKLGFEPAYAYWSRVRD
jgi:GNAT superfamily N-acetyltransferase